MRVVFPKRGSSPDAYVIMQEDGIIFESSQKGAGHRNIVVFNKDNAHMVGHQQRTVGEIEMKFEPFPTATIQAVPCR